METCVVLKILYICFCKHPAMCNRGLKQEGLGVSCKKQKGKKKTEADLKLPCASRTTIHTVGVN